MCPNHYHAALLVLAYIAAVTMAHTALTMGERLHRAGPRSWRLWAAGGAVSVGTGIWSMQFIASVAASLAVHPFQDLPLALASIGCALAAGAAAMAVLRRRPTRLHWLVGGGTLVGWLAMSSFYSSAASVGLHVSFFHRPFLFLSTFVLAAGAATAVLWAALRLVAMGRGRITARLAAALLMGVAIIGIELLAAQAMRAESILSCPPVPSLGKDEAATYGVFAFGLTILLSTLLLSAHEARMSTAVARSAEKLRRANHDLEQRVQERTRTLAREEARKDAMLRATLDCIVTMDTDGRIVEVNPQAERTFGWHSDEMVGRDLAETIVPERLRAAHNAGLARLLATGTSTVIGRRIEISAIRRGGEEFPVELALAAMELDGKPFFTAHLRDITDRKRAEQDLRDASKAAQAASQAKSAFLATMSHEIRTPMNAVIGMLELLSLTPLNDEQHEMLSTVRESSHALLAQIDDILDFSKIEAGKLEIVREPCAVRDLVAAIAAVFAGVASAKGLVLATRIDPALWPAHQVDGVRLRQILGNFVSNAVKFTAAGTVTLSVDVIETADATQQLRFGVLDTGIGMSAQTQQRLFEPFEQAESDTNRRFGGTGLGLAISQRLAGLMDAHIDVASAERLGTRIELTLPAQRADARAVGAARRQGAAVPMPFDSQTADAVGGLLIVDDHPVNRRMLQRQLGVLGLRADAASGGADALRQWRQGRHALIITDCQMPEMDGYALTRAIREEAGGRAAGGPTIIAFTAHSHREAVEQCRQVGMDDYLAKPAELATLRDKLAGWMSSASRPARPCDAPAALTPACPFNGAIDMDRLAELAGGTDGVSEVLQEFLAAVDDDLAALRAALAGGDAAALQSAAHRIRGAALTIGATKLSCLASELEQSAHRSDAARLERMIGQLAHELRSLADARMSEHDAIEA